MNKIFFLSIFTYLVHELKIEERTYETLKVLRSKQTLLHIYNPHCDVHILYSFTLQNQYCQPLFY
jgi:hypothetical protein